MPRLIATRSRNGATRGIISDLSQHKDPDRTSRAKLKKEASKKAEKKGEEAEEGGAEKVEISRRILPCSSAEWARSASSPRQEHCVFEVRQGRFGRKPDDRSRFQIRQRR